METPEKTQDGKTGAPIRYRNMELLQSLQIHPNLANAVPDIINEKIPTKPQHPPVREYDPVVRSSVILLLAPPSSQLNLLSDFLSLSVSYLYQNTSGVCSLHQLISLL